MSDARYKNYITTLVSVLLCRILSCAQAWNSVQISTCGAPVLGTPLSICCFTENLPDEASVYFSTTSGHVARIGSSCGLWFPSNRSIVDFSWNCSTRGNTTVYKLTYPDLLSKQNDNERWQCGFYGNKDEISLTVLDTHTSEEWSPGSSPLIHFTIPGDHDSSVTLTLYHLQTNQTLLEVDMSDNKVVYHSSRLNYTGDILKNRFSAVLLNIGARDNGTYVGQYRTTGGDVYRIGFTLVVLERPARPVLHNTSSWRINGDKMVGNVSCDAISGSAAPLFYQSTMTIQWYIPTADDWRNGNVGYNVSTNDSIAYITNMDCKEKTRLPIYCRVTERSEISDLSSAFFPQNMCTKPEASSKDTGTGDPKYRALVIGICVTVSIAVYVVVITTVVARRFLKKKFRKCCRCFRKCCRSCAGDSSDSDSDLDEVLRRSRDDVGGLERRRLPALADGLRPPRDHRTDEFQQALEQIAAEESRQNQLQYSIQAQDIPDSPDLGSDNPFFLNLASPREPTDDDNIQQDGGELGAVGGAPADDEIALLKEVETLLDQHNRHLGRDVVTLQVSRDNILENVFGYYTEESLAMSRVAVKFVGEEGMDCGGVTFDMYTTFWAHAQEKYFLGYEAVVPYLPPHRFSDDSKYRTLGRILSHTIAVMKAFPIHMCKSTIISMIYETTEVSAEVVLEDFLYFLDDHDRSLVTTGINNFSSLTREQTDDLATIFQRFDYGGVISADNFRQHVTQLARHVTCIRPRPLLDLMRAGIPPNHLNYFWSRFHLNTLDILFRALKPTADRVIARLKPSENRHLSRRRKRVMEFLKDLLREMSEPELETFLHFVTGRKSMPRDKITIEFTTESGNLRLPKAHTCSNMMELPESYENYDTFRSEFKHLLASDEALKMTME